MRPADHYLDLSARDDDEGAPRQGATGEFLLRCILGARAEAELPSNERGFDEDVNVYLAGLLGRFLSAAWHEQAASYLYPSDIDLAEAVRENPDQRHRFRVYRTNADHLLLSIGLFCHVQGASNLRNPAFHREPDEFIGRGGSYYHQASHSLRRLRRRETGAEQALRTLGTNFGDYVDLLRRLRVSYFHLTARLGEGTLHHLITGERPGEGQAGADEVATLYDAFLDAFNGWQEDRSFATRRKLVGAARALREADPDFAFELPPEDDDRGIRAN